MNPASPPSDLTAAWRPEFPGLERSTYMNTCSLGQLSRRSRAAMGEFMDLWERHGARAWYELWLGKIDETRARFARLIGAEPREIAIVPSVGVALSVIGGALDYRERPEVVATHLDFPTVAYQWMARAREGARLRLLESPDKIQVPIEDFERAIGPRTALVATSHVCFTSGWIQDIAAIARLAREQGALTLIDGYHGAGQVPLDVEAADVDVYISGGLKWLIGGPGIVFMYVRDSLIERLEPTTTGWFGAKDMFAFDPERFERAPDARRFEAGTPATAAVYAAEAGLSIIEEIGPEAIRRRTRELDGDLIARLRAAGLEPRLPADMERHAGIVILPVERPGEAVRALAETRNIIIDYRPGALRLSPYFYNTEAENQTLVEGIVEVLAAAAAT